MKENDAEVEESIERAYYVTLGLAYEKPGRLAGSAFEPLLKKCDHFMRRTDRERLSRARGTSRHVSSTRMLW